MRNDDDDFDIHRGLSQRIPLNKLPAASLTGAISLAIGQRKPFPAGQDQEYALVESFVMLMLDDDDEEEDGLIME